MIPVNAHITEREAVAREVDTRLAAVADAWRKLLRLDAEVADVDFRGALAAHGLPGSYIHRGEEPKPLALRLKVAA